MSELNETWAEALVEAERRAREAGRADVLEYLSLRASNDYLRVMAIEWLTGIFVDEANQADGNRVKVERRDEHHFAVGNATMRGVLLSLRKGVRALELEAGWPRVPGDGIITGGGLAKARIRHFGERGANAELLLVRATSGAPQWFSLEEIRARAPFTTDDVRRHILKLLDH